MNNYRYKFPVLEEDESGTKTQKFQNSVDRILFALCVIVIPPILIHVIWHWTFHG